MEVKPGYKQTEVGVIPEEWQVSRIGALCAAVLDCHHSTPVWTTSGSVVIRNQNIRDGKLDFSQPSFTDEIHFAERTRRAVPSFGDLVITREAPMGLVCMIPEGLKCCLGQRMVLLRPNHDAAETEYLLYALLSEAVQRSISVAGGTGSTVSNLRIPVLKGLEISAPPLPEQRAIATALSDVDGLLGGLDRLIAKKRDLKQAAMQQLLTGQTRLPGFHGEWEVKRLGDVFTISAGKSKSAFIAENGDFWICDMGSVSTEGRLIVSKGTNHRCDFLRKGDLIMPKDDIGGGNIIGKVGYIDANETYILGDHVYCLRALEGDPRFLAFTINSHRVNSELRKKVIGSAQLGLGRKSVTEQEIQIPPTPEQAAIAEVLTDMDAELAVLEQRREKTRGLKQAMMQELLTGRTRLL